MRALRSPSIQRSTTRNKIGPDRLRTGIAAPGAAYCRGHEKQPDAGHDQQARDVVEFLRPDFDEEKIEAPMGEIDQHGLIGRIGAAIPAQPGRQVIDAKGHRHDDPFEMAEIAARPLGMDFDARRIELPLARGVDRLHVECATALRLRVDRRIAITIRP